MIIDTHAHYDDEAFDADREELLCSMKDRGVETVINVGATLKGASDSVELAEKYPFMYAAAGVHPDETGTLSEEKMLFLRELCSHKKTVAVGETGLDYYWNKESQDTQKKWFVRQIDLAKETHLPIVVHSRNAAKDTLDIMKVERADQIPGVIHCYSYSREHAKEYMNMGYYLGIGGVITFADAKRLKEVVAYAPLDYLLLETDAPYLAPEPYRRGRNQSGYLSYVAEAIGRIKGIPAEEVIRVTRENAKQLFRI